jgi:hypothetical protein
VKRTSSSSAGKTDVPPDAGRLRRLAWPLLWLALALLSSLITFDPKLYINGDNIDYIRLAESARHGVLWGSAKFPPLFPWLLVLPQSIFGLALIPQKILVWLFYAGSAVLLMRRAERSFPGRWGPPIAWVAVTLIPVLEYGHYVMSEVPYLFFSLLALEAFDRIGRTGRAALLGAALAAAATFYTRSVGLALWAGLAVALFVRPVPGMRRKATFVVASAILLLPWVLHSLLGAANPYFLQLLQVNPFHPEWGRLDAAGWVGRIAENVRIYISGEIPTGLLPVIFRWTYDPPELRYHFLPLAIAWIPLLLLGIGLVLSLRAREPLGYYVVLYLLINLLWPNLWTGLRFLVPVLPLMTLLLFRGLLWGLGVTAGRFPRRSAVAAVLVGIWILLGIKNQTSLAQGVQSYPPAWDAYFQAATWIRDHTPKDALVVDRKPTMMSYVTGRRAINFPREEDPAKLIAWMARERVDYVLVSAIPYDDIVRYLIPAVQEEQDRFTPVFEREEPYTVLLRFNPVGAP